MTNALAYLKPTTCLRYNFAAILWLQFMVHVMLFPIINVLCFQDSTFCSSLMSCFPGILFRHFPKYFETAPVASLISGTTLGFILLLLLLLLLTTINRCYNGYSTASVVQWSEFLATDTEVPGSIPGATRFSEQQWVWNGVHSAS